VIRARLAIFLPPLTAPMEPSSNFSPHTLNLSSYSSLDPLYSLLLGPPTMRHAQIFSGSSHPALVQAICDRLGQKAGQAELRKFSNGETSVQIRRFSAPNSCRARRSQPLETSIRDQDVFIVQSGSEK